MNEWTVIGVYTDNGDTYTEVVAAKTALQAMAKSTEEVQDDADNLLVLGAVAGRHHLVPADEDRGRAAYAADLLDIVW